MVPHLVPPGRTCDGWRVYLCSEAGPGRILAGTGATRGQAIQAALHEGYILVGILAVLAREIEVADREGIHRAALEELQRTAALYLVGDLPREDLARACIAVEEAREV